MRADEPDRQHQGPHGPAHSPQGLRSRRAPRGRHHRRGHQRQHLHRLRSPRPRVWPSRHHRHAGLDEPRTQRPLLRSYGAKWSTGQVQAVSRQHPHGRKTSPPHATTSFFRSSFSNNANIEKTPSERTGNWARLRVRAPVRCFWCSSWHRRHRDGRWGVPGARNPASTTTQLNLPNRPISTGRAGKHRIQGISDEFIPALGGFQMPR